MRITVRRVLELIYDYPDRAELFREYPFLEDEDLRQALQYAGSYADFETYETEQTRVAGGS